MPDSNSHFYNNSIPCLTLNPHEGGWRGRGGGHKCRPAGPQPWHFLRVCKRLSPLLLRLACHPRRRRRCWWGVESPTPGNMSLRWTLKKLTTSRLLSPGLCSSIPRFRLLESSPVAETVLYLFIYFYFFCFPRFYARIRARCCWTVLLVLMLLALLLVLEWIFYLIQYKECWRIDSGVLLISIDGCWCGFGMLWLVS